MSKLPIISAQDLEKILLYLEFIRKRQLGSYVFFQHYNGRAMVFPVHSGVNIGRGIIAENIARYWTGARGIRHSAPTSFMNMEGVGAIGFFGYRYSDLVLFHL